MQMRKNKFFGFNALFASYTRQNNTDEKERKILPLFKILVAA